MKKIVIPFMLMLLVVTIKVDAAYEEFASTEKTNTTKLVENLAQTKEVSLNDAIFMAEAKIASKPEYSSKLKDLLLVHQKNVSDFGEVKRKVDDDGNYYYQYLYGTPNTNPVASIKELEKQYDDEVDKATSKVKSLYFDIVESNRNLDIARLKVEQSKADLKSAEIKLEFGTTNKSEVYAKKANLASAEATSLSQAKSLDTKIRDFKLLTNLENVYFSTEYKFSLDNLIESTKDNLKSEYYIPVNIDKDIYEKHTTLESLYEQLSDKETALKNVTKGYSEDSKYYYDKEEDLGLPLLRDQVKEAELALEISYSGDQAKLKIQIDYFQQAELTLDLAKTKYEQSTVKYNSGQITYASYLSAKIEWIEALKKYDNSIEEIYLAVDSFNLEYNI